MAALNRELPAGELACSIREQGFTDPVFLQSAGLPQTLQRHPRVHALGRGTFVLTALSCHAEEPGDLSTPADPHALIAPFARRNYYAEAVARLKTVVRTLGQTRGLSRRQARIFCNSAIPEKALAVAGGLGVYGKNSLLLIPGMGSLFVIAGLFLPLAVSGAEADPGAAAHPDGSFPPAAFPLCQSCRACQQACPASALEQAGRLDESRCLQACCTRTAAFSEEMRRSWAFRFYGCQSCQEVCPHNRELEGSDPPQRGALGPSLSLKELLSLSPGQFAERLRGTTLDRSWIPLRALLRNALLAAGNRGDPALLEAVNRHAGSGDLLISDAAAWAADRIRARCSGGKE